MFVYRIRNKETGEFTEGTRVFTRRRNLINHIKQAYKYRDYSSKKWIFNELPKNHEIVRFQLTGGETFQNVEDLKKNEQN